MAIIARLRDENLFLLSVSVHGTDFGASYHVIGHAQFIARQFGLKHTFKP